MAIDFRSFSPRGLLATFLCSLQYTSVDDITTQVLTTGRGTLMAKIDIKNAYRNIPIHPTDRHLLGMEWQHQLYVNGALPFGLRSAPKIFNTVADALEWILQHRGVETYIIIWMISSYWGIRTQRNAHRG